MALVVVMTQTCTYPTPSRRVLALLGLLVEGYLPLTGDELEDWTDQPEDYYLLQDSIEARESVRVSWRVGLGFESAAFC